MQSNKNKHTEAFHSCISLCHRTLKCCYLTTFSRLSEATVQPIGMQVEDLYRKHSNNGAVSPFERLINVCDRIKLGLADLVRTSFLPSLQI